MKYAVWFVRLVFAAWMIPAGLNHFVPLFPQPMGSQPLSHELIVALLDSHLFDIVKAVELIAGICVLTGVLHSARAHPVHAGLVLRVLLGCAARGLGLARRDLRLFGAVL